MKSFNDSGFNKKYQKAKLHFKDFHQKVVVRVWNLAKRMDVRNIKRNVKK